MRLLRLGPPGAERPAVLLDDATAADVCDLVDDFDAAFLAGNGLASLASADLADRPRHELAGARIGAPIARPGKIVCVGLNYADHAAESGMPCPDEPILFFKDPASVVGPGDEVYYPRGAAKLDWEVELAVIVGRRGRYLDDPHDALACVAGYCVANDVSERSFQLERGGQWVKGKSCETFCPLGPWLVTPDEAADPQSLGLWLDVNGEPAQRGNTKTMIFGVATLIHYISQFMVLEPGDVVLTGTPPGVGMGLRPPRYLIPGDIVRLGIDGLGEQQQRIVPAPDN